VTTPFYSDERFITAKLRPHRALLAQFAGGDGGFRLDGRGAACRDAESREVLRVAAEAAAPEKVLIAGVGRESVKATVELAVAAAEFRYDAVLIRRPVTMRGRCRLPRYFIIFQRCRPLAASCDSLQYSPMRSLSDSG